MRWRWQEPPNWPPPPPGFLPPPGWLPSPSWPAAPLGWRFWTRTSAGRARLAVCWVSVGFVALLLLAVAGGIYSDRGKHAAFVARRDRGVVAQAQVLSSHYDADGGDPNGWTREVVLIPTPHSKVLAVVGHHGPEPGGRPATVAVIYDPLRPTNAQTVQDFNEFGDYSDGLTDRGAVRLSIVLTSVAVGTVAIAALVLHRPRRTPPGWVAAGLPPSP